MKEKMNTRKQEECVSCKSDIYVGVRSCIVCCFSLLRKKHERENKIRMIEEHGEVELEREGQTKLKLEL